MYLKGLRGLSTRLAHYSGGACQRSTKWIAENSESLGLDPMRLVLVGDSVGGNIATVVAMMAKERGGPEITFQVLFYPVTDATFSSERLTTLLCASFCRALALPI